MHIGAGHRVRWALTLVAAGLFVLAAAVGCGNTTSAQVPGPTPTVGPQLQAQEVVGIVKNTLAEKTYSGRALPCLGTFGYKAFQATFQGKGQWEISTVGGTQPVGTTIERAMGKTEPFTGRWSYSERTERVTWVSAASRPDCDF